MTTISRSFHVSTPPATVLEYLKDFSNAEEWDPGTESCEQIGTGPVQVGTQFHNVSKIAGIETERTYTLVALTDTEVRFEGSNDTANTIDTITVTPRADGGSDVTYVAEIDMHGAAKLATPVVKLVFERIGTETEEKLTEVLNALPSQA